MIGIVGLMNPAQPTRFCGVPRPKGAILSDELYVVKGIMIRKNIL